eukprot:636625-Rhodomonas_salina.3
MANACSDRSLYLPLRLPSAQNQSVREHRALHRAHVDRGLHATCVRRATGACRTTRERWGRGVSVRLAVFEGMVVVVTHENVDWEDSDCSGDGCCCVLLRKVELRDVEKKRTPGSARRSRGERIRMNEEKDRSGVED